MGATAEPKGIGVGGSAGLDVCMTRGGPAYIGALGIRGDPMAPICGTMAATTADI